jgi:uncharacterized protein (DUF1778 family)
MQTIKHKSGLYKFLDETKVLEWGAESDIALARKKYKRIYQALWRKEQRKKKKGLTTSWDAEQLSVITLAAKRHKLSRTAYIQQAAIAHSKKQFLVIDAYAVSEIKELLTMNYSAVKRLFDTSHIPHQAGKDALDKIIGLETTITE